MTMMTATTYRAKGKISMISTKRHFPENENTESSLKCSWRSKVKYCPVCQGVITNLPKSLFVARTYCSRKCASIGFVKNPKKAHPMTDTTVAAGVLVAEVISALTDWDWWECSVMSVEIIKEYQHRRQIGQGINEI